MHLPLLPASRPSQIESALRPPPTPASLTALTCTMAWSGAMRDSGDGHGQPNTSFFLRMHFRGARYIRILHCTAADFYRGWIGSVEQCSALALSCCQPAKFFLVALRVRAVSQWAPSALLSVFFTDDKAERCRTAVLKSTLSLSSCSALTRNT